MPDDTALVAASHVTYAVGGRDLVHDVSLRVEPGALIAIVGPNGSGKTTLLRLLCGELGPDRGGVTYGGVPVAKLPPWHLACLRAVLPQATRVSFPFTAAEIARIGLEGIGKGLSRTDRQTILDRAMREAEVAHLAERTYWSLSGGEQARVQFARVLCQIAAARTLAPRPVLFLDEPTASLDLCHQSSLLESVSALRLENLGVVVILHDLNLASVYADEIVVLDEGRLVARGRPADVVRDDIIAGVFGVDWPVGSVPADARPFLLPRRSVAHAQRS